MRSSFWHVGTALTCADSFVSAVQRPATGLWVYGLASTVGLRMNTVRTAIMGPVRRLEVFTRAGRRRTMAASSQPEIVTSW